jgi:hypothetical protein
MREMGWVGRSWDLLGEVRSQIPRNEGNPLSRDVLFRGHLRWPLTGGVRRVPSPLKVNVDYVDVVIETPNLEARSSPARVNVRGRQHLIGLLKGHRQLLQISRLLIVRG